MRRASRVYLTCANVGKVYQLRLSLLLYVNVVNYFIERFWTMKDFTSALADKVITGRAVNRFKITARLAQCAAKQAKEIVRSQRERKIKTMPSAIEIRGAPTAAGFSEQALKRIGSLPGVQAVGTSTSIPTLGGGDTYFTIEGKPFPDLNRKVTALNPMVSHDYLRTMKIPLIKGRHFTEPETKEEKAKAVIINEAFARAYFADDEPLGKRLIIDMGEPWTCEIVGVARDTTQFALGVSAYPLMYLPSIRAGVAAVVIRSSGDPLALTASVRESVREVDRDLPIANIRSMDQIMSSMSGDARFRTLLLGVFAAVALLLAAIGIYGVISYSVAQRAREIGIRIAIGAQNRDVLRLVVGQGMKLALLGIGVGIAGALAFTRVLSGLLFNVSATDPLTFVGVSTLLALVALLACYVPARRAMSVDPMVALRCE
jgi:putative ABC transport system permease protein